MSDSEFQHISIIIISQAVIKHGHINAHTALLQPTSPPQPPLRPTEQPLPVPCSQRGSHKRTRTCWD